jgi:5-hydroxyisourate hydrolase
VSAITTHILDTARGRPAAGVAVTLDQQTDDGWQTIGRGVTDADGRLRDLLSAERTVVPGTYRLSFDTAGYFDAQGVATFYPSVVVVFTVAAREHYHVPLLVSPFGYSTYRGS